MRSLALVVWVASVGCAGDGPRANYIFASSTLHTGDFGGPAGADAICAQLASDAKLDGTFVAWIADQPFDRLDGSRGWVRLDGVPVADQPSDFLEGGVLDPVSIDELGNPQRSGDVLAWTGIAADGSQQLDCTGWTSNMPTGGTVGVLGGGSSNFSSYGYVTCDRAAHLICTEIGKSMPVSIEGTTGRTAFISSDLWLPGAGIADADLVCQTDAQQAALGGTYLAVLSTSTASAASRFDLSGAPWIRIDGAQIAPTAQQLFTADYWSTFVNQYATGSLVAAGTFYWGGEPAGPGYPTTTCQDWTFGEADTNIGAALGTVAADHASAFDVVRAACNTPEHLLCLEQ